jgi:hypothetical protein
MTGEDMRLGRGVIAALQAAAEGMTADGWGLLLQEVPELLRKSGMFRLTRKPVLSEPTQNDRDANPQAYLDRSPEAYCAALGAWLHDLARAVEARAVPASDIAQALFREDTYTVTCPLSEQQNERCDRLIARADRLYPVPALAPTCQRCLWETAPGARGARGNRAHV